MTKYEIKEEKNPLDKSIIMRRAYTLSGDYIGNEKHAKYLCDELGIAPEKRDQSHSVCSIGFCEKEQKWYGWSHRAIYGFGIGSIVKFGDIAYSPKNEKDAVRAAVNFWDDLDHMDVIAGDVKTDADGSKYVDIEWRYSNSVPNLNLRGKTSRIRHYLPKNYGNGKWIAKNLYDAKRMACDFANGVD